MKVYDFLSSALRMLDRHGLLERYMGAVQVQFDYTQAQIKELKRLADLSLANDDEVEYIAALLGWDFQGETSFVPRDNPILLRRFAKFGVELWASKGTRSITADAINTLAGERPIIQDGFDVLPLIDRATMGEGGWYSDSYMGFHSYFANGAEVLEDYQSLNTSLIFIEGFDLSTETRRVLYDLLHFLRPMGSHYLVFYVPFLTLFLDKSSGSLELDNSPPMATLDSQRYRDERLTPALISLRPEPTFGDGAMLLDPSSTYGFTTQEGAVNLNAESRTVNTYLSANSIGAPQDRRMILSVEIPDKDSDSSRATIITAMFFQVLDESFVELAAMRLKDERSVIYFEKTIPIALPYEFNRDCIEPIRFEFNATLQTDFTVMVSVAVGGGERVSLASARPTLLVRDSEADLSRVRVSSLSTGFNLYSLKILGDNTEVQPIFELTAYENSKMPFIG